MMNINMEPGHFDGGHVDHPEEEMLGEEILEDEEYVEEEECCGDFDDITIPIMQNVEKFAITESKVGPKELLDESMGDEQIGLTLREQCPEKAPTRLYGNVFDDHGPIDNYTMEEAFPELSNENVLHQLEKMGKFNYFPDYTFFEGNPYYLVKLNDIEAVYYGQWRKHQRCGKGKMIFANGDFYEGFWMNDQANLRGR